MKKHTVLMVLMLVAVLMTIVACGGNKGNSAPAQQAQQPQVIKEYQPEWWLVQEDEAYFYAYGQATKVSKTVAFDAAKANALLEAAQFVSTKVQGMIKNFEQESGVNNPEVLALTSKVVKAISDATFNNVVTGKSEAVQVMVNGEPRYNYFVQVRIPKTEVNKNLANQIRNEEALYNQFKASQAFQELDAAIAK